MNKPSLLAKLPVAAPPMLEQAIGYFGDACFVALFFGVDDEIYYADGRITASCEWDAADLFINNPIVALHLRPYHLGSSDEPPTHYLLLDRESRTLSVIPAAEAWQLLREQWVSTPTEPESVLVVSSEDLERLVSELMIQIRQCTPAQIAADWRAHQWLVEKLALWLAEQWEG